jgi:hypothetical protein
MRSIDGWHCYVSQGSRCAVHPGDPPEQVTAHVRPDGTLVAEGVIPPAVVDWLTERVRPVRTPDEHAAALAEITRLMGAVTELRLTWLMARRWPGRSAGRLQDALARLPCPECNQTAWMHDPDCGTGLGERGVERMRDPAPVSDPYIELAAGLLCGYWDSRNDDGRPIVDAVADALRDLAKERDTARNMARNCAETRAAYQEQRDQRVSAEDMATLRGSSAHVSAPDPLERYGTGHPSERLDLEGASDVEILDAVLRLRPERARWVARRLVQLGIGQ